MAQSVSEMLQEIVNSPYEQKILGAQSTLADCFDIMTGRGIDLEQAKAFIITFLAAAAAADGEFSAPERNMLRDMFDDDLEGIVGMIDREKFDMMDRFVDSLNASDKSSFILLAIYVTAVDDAINKDELTYLVKLMQ
ncbi:MAG: hypothetical protein IJK54_02950 [Clostridia bacterium]|nr:hypothetical protein [Clostridia bacterium]